MIVLSLITCIVLRALTAQAKVDYSFDECKQFFYKGVEPIVGDYGAEICQKLKNKGFYYATLYSFNYRIPLYSAYTLDPKCSCDTGRSKFWHLEPQMSQYESPIDHMVRESRNTQNRYKEKQAIGSDYRNTSYDRGHLNPNFFQCNEGRIATSTLTNAAPMNRDFNQIHWNYLERTLRDYLIEKLARDDNSATAFIVTGTVPDPYVWIPEDNYRVSVPSHIWTAVCYKHHTDDTKSFSFSYIGRNHNEEPALRMMNVSALQTELHNLWPYGFDPDFDPDSISIQIFDDDCFGDNNKLNEVKNVFQNNQEDQRSLTYEYYCFNISRGSINNEGECCYIDSKAKKQQPHLCLML